MESTIPDLEVSSFLNCENILDSEIDLEEIECALKALKLGKSGGIDSLDPEHYVLVGSLSFFLLLIVSQCAYTLWVTAILLITSYKLMKYYNCTSYRGGLGWLNEYHYRTASEATTLGLKQPLSFNSANNQDY